VPTVAEAQPAAPAPPTVVTVVKVAPAAMQKASLSVTPAGVEVKVDGVAVPVTNGRVELEGAVGTTRQVELSFGGKTETRVVAFAESGLVPDKLEIGVTPPPPPTARGGKKSATPAPPRTQTAATTKAEKKKSTGLDEGTGEFK
jgi:hypothetical protein